MSNKVLLDVDLIAVALRQNLLDAGVNPPEDADIAELFGLLERDGQDPWTIMMTAITNLLAGAKLPAGEIIIGEATEVIRTPEMDEWDEIFAEIRRA